MITPSHDKLDATLAKLPRGIEPERDLWPGIAARIRKRRLYAWPHLAWNIAAAAAVIAAAVIIAWTVTPVHVPSSGAQPFAAISTPHGATAETEDPRTQFMAQLASDTRLPPKARGALLDNLRLVHEDILRTHAAVEKYPDDVNLRALLFNLYQQEAHLLNEAQQAQIQTSTRIVI